MDVEFVVGEGDVHQQQKIEAELVSVAFLCANRNRQMSGKMKMLCRVG